MPAATDNVRDDVLNQSAVYWEKTGVNNLGKTIYASPVQIACRWENKTEVMLQPDGKYKEFKHWIILDRDVEVDSVLWLGLLADLVDAAEPYKNKGAVRVASFCKLPTREADEFLREAYS